MDEDRAEPQTELDKAETDAYGENFARGPDGQPLERGHGSRYAKMHPSARAHLHILKVHAATDALIAQAKGMVDVATKLAADSKAAVESALAAKAQPIAATAADEPTVQQYVAAGYSAKNYRYSRSSPDEIKAAIAAEDAAQQRKQENAESDAVAETLAQRQARASREAAGL